MSAKDKPCPSCGASDWYADYHRTADGERRVDHCEECDWPPGTPMSPQEWREHPKNPLNADRTREVVDPSVFAKDSEKRAAGREWAWHALGESVKKASNTGTGSEE